MPQFVYFDGFGFLCMKEAYKNNIKGVLHYGPNLGVHIVAVGKSDELEAFNIWLRSLCPKGVNIVQKQNIRYSKFSEFDIIYTDDIGLSNISSCKLK
jgi:acylphosphatase